MLRILVLFALMVPVLGQLIDECVIPRKTEIFLTLERSISTRTALSGDKFYGRVAVPVTMNDRIVIPTGSYIIGHVDTSKEAGYLRGKSELGLRFDTVILPDGTTREMQAVLASAEGYEASDPREEGKVRADSEQGQDIGTGAAIGGATGASIGSIAARGWKGAGIGAGVGVATGAVLGALRKGKPVDLPRGTSITIVLDNDVQFVKPAPPSRGKAL